MTLSGSLCCEIYEFSDGKAFEHCHYISLIVTHCKGNQKQQGGMGIQGLSKVIGDYAPSAVKENEIKNYFGESRSNTGLKFNLSLSRNSHTPSQSKILCSWR